MLTDKARSKSNRCRKHTGQAAVLLLVVLLLGTFAALLLLLRTFASVLIVLAGLCLAVRLLHILEEEAESLDGLDDDLIGRLLPGHLMMAELG